MELCAFVDWMADTRKGVFIFALINALFYGGVAFALQFFHVIGNSIVWYLVAMLPFSSVLTELRKRGGRSKLLLAMYWCYNAMNGDGPISAQYIREQLGKAAEKSVVWPAPIYALLDDVMTRSGRL
jgi:hypothetical protein